MYGLLLTALLASALPQAIAGRRFVERQEAPPGPTASGTTPYCSFYLVHDGSYTCENIVNDLAVPLESFLRWNPSVGSSCNLVIGNAYCIEAADEPAPSTTTTVSTTSKATTTTTLGPPGPTQTGQHASCDRWDLVADGNTCATFTSKYPGLSTALLYEWNQAIAADCSNLWANTYLCTRIKGWTPSTTTTKTTTKATTTTSKASVTSNGISTPTPTQPDMVGNCNKFYFVETGNTCDTITSKTGATLSQLYTWNPSIQKDCSGLWANTYVCVGTTTVTVTKTTTTTTKSTTTKTTSTNGITTPTPFREGMTTKCNLWHLTRDGSTCAGIYEKYGITAALFLAWNPTVGSDCSGLWAKYYYCVNIIGRSTTTTTTKKTTTKTTTTGNGIATPTPFREGMTTKCNLFHLTRDGSTCAGIYEKYGITAALFLAWNPTVGSDCSGLWAKYNYCVNIIGRSTTTTTTKKATTTSKKPTTTGNGVKTPTPTQTGMTKSCKTFRLVQTGDTCANLQSKYSITFAQLYKWNPAIGSNCETLWLKYYVCVAVL